MRKEVVFTYLDLKFIPNYPVNRSILPGFPTNPNDILEEFIKTDNNLWLVTEFCNGGSLEELISANPNGIKTPVMRTLMRKILDGFSELVHNDLL